MVAPLAFTFAEAAPISKKKLAYDEAGSEAVSGSNVTVRAAQASTFAEVAPISKKKLAYLKVQYI
ncbi:hypothetical protein FACS1894122_13770 [Alphaproteobacteria bacterium]|nr:hypothetical protein FACS1894122_13770 [Alphaproteobacteria bacterium]